MSFLLSLHIFIPCMRVFSVALPHKLSIQQTPFSIGRFETLRPLSSIFPAGTRMNRRRVADLTTTRKSRHNRWLQDCQ